MVVVPIYQQTEQLRPANRQNIDVNATAESFGAAQGRGLQQFAQGIQNLGGAIEKVQQLEDVTRAKEADNNYSNWMRESMYGENGFMVKEGRNAVDGRAQFEQDAEAKRKEFGKDLTPGAAQAYQTASQARLKSTLDQSIVHTANERKKWFGQASDARLNTFAEDALAGSDKPAIVQKNIAAGQAEIRQQAELLGWDADTLKNREAEYVSSVHSQIAMRKAALDPIAAKKYADEHKDQMTGEAQANLEKTFAPLIIDEEAKRKADEFQQLPASSTRFGATDLPMAAYNLLGVIAGPESGGRYDIRFDGRSGAKITDFSDHPRIASRIPGGFQEAGKRSSAAGKYQFIESTWDRASRATGTVDFSPASQDKNAWWLAQMDYRSQTGRDINADLAAGNYSAVRKGLAGTWEGLSRMSDAKFAAKMQQGGGAAANNDPVEFLERIENPLVRDATAQRLKANMAAQSSAQKVQAEAIKTQAFSVVDQGASPDSLPMEVRTALGREEMSGLWSYYEARTKGGQPVTDDAVKYDLQTMYAQDPESFAEVSLFQYRDKLNDADWKEVTGWRQTALTDQRKAKEDGITLTTAFSQSNDALEAIGITTTGKEGAQREEMAKRIALFQNSLATQMQEFKAQTSKAPNQIEIQSMVNKLLLPVVISEPGMLWGTNATEGKRLFEAGSRTDAQSVDVAVEYGDIPIDLRRGISTDLERELGRKPSQDEIVQRYEYFILNQ